MDPRLRVKKVRTRHSSSDPKKQQPQNKEHPVFSKAPHMHKKGPLFEQQPGTNGRNTWYIRDAIAQMKIVDSVIFE